MLVAGLGRSVPRPYGRETGLDRRAGARTVFGSCGFGLKKGRPCEAKSMQDRPRTRLGGDVGADGYSLGSGWLCERARLIALVL
jgi:hypothetical protein